MAKYPASLCCTTIPCCICKSWPVKRLLSGRQYLPENVGNALLCGIINLFSRKRQGPISSQTSQCQPFTISAALLSPTFWVTLCLHCSSPGLALEFLVGGSSSIVSCMQSCTYEYFGSFLWLWKSAQELAPESLVTYRLWNQEYFCWIWCHPGGKSLLGQKLRAEVPFSSV